MEPGVPALLLLPAVTIAGRVLGNLYVEKALGGLAASCRGKLAKESVATAAVAAVFWAWAAFKLLAKHDPDLGVVTFLCAFVACYRTADLCAVEVRRGSQSRAASMLRQQTCTHPACLWAVSANYALAPLAVGVAGLPYWFRWYIIMGAVYWAVMALRAHQLLSDDGYGDRSDAHGGGLLAHEKQGLHRRSGAQGDETGDENSGI